MFHRRFLSLILIFFLASPAWCLQVMIDPGHGGKDTGTSREATKEKDLVLKVAGYLKTLLQDDPQFSVTMTRGTDQHVSLAERVRQAELAQADIFVSLHVNSNPDPRAKGLEIYFQNSLPPDEESLLLAHQENENETAESLPAEKSTAPSKKSDILAIVEDLHREARAKSSLLMTQLLSKDWKETKLSPVAIRQAPFYVVSKTSMPAILVEIGFITHPTEGKMLTSPKFQQEIAQKIYKALGQYKEMMDKIEGQALE